MKISKRPEKRTTEVWDVCTCGETLYSLCEAESGQCSQCWFKAMSPEKKKAMNRVIACAFNGASDQEKLDAVDEALRHLDK